MLGLPQVTWALTIVGKCHPVQMAAYLISQLVGSLIGALLLSLTLDDDKAGSLGSNTVDDDGVGGAFLGEMMGTMLLVLVVLETAVNSGAVTTQEQGKQNLAPIAIGLAVFMAHVVLIPITGCSINPTRSFGPAILSGKPSNSWLFWVAPLCGSTVGSLLWFVVQMFAPNKVAAAPADDKDDDDEEEERDEDDA